MRLTRSFYTLSLVALIGSLCPVAHSQGDDIPLVTVDEFDNASKNQPKNTYNPATDKTVVQIVKDPKLDKAVIDLVTSPTILKIRQVPITQDRGPEVDKFIRFCGLKPPQWWCAAFVSYQIHQASKTSGVFTSWPKAASCDYIYGWGKKHKLLLDEPGIPSVMLIKAKKGADRQYKHTGIVVDYDPDTKIITVVEGNSNNNGSSNGIGVFRLRRKVQSSMVFVKIN